MAAKQVGGEHPVGPVPAGPSAGRTHELQGNGSLRKCFGCGRWFHNEADAGAEDEPCDGTIQIKDRA